MSARGFGFTTQGYYNLNLTIASNTSSYNVYSAALAAGWTGTNPLNLTLNINSGVVVSGTGTGTSAAIIINNIVPKSIITINNNGTVVGSGGTLGGMGQNGYVNTTWAVGNGPNCVGTGYTSTGSNGYGYGNYSGTIYYYGPGIGGNWPVYDSYSGGTGSNGGNGGNGGTALYLASNVNLFINNYATGLFVGGGGGCGGMGGNNNGGGVGGTGGYCIEETGSHPAVIANNIAGSSSNPVVNGIIASGGGGAGGWGNRYEGEGHGGYYGASAVQFNWTGAGATPGISPGLATNNTGTTLINTTGQFTLSPAV